MSHSQCNPPALLRTQKKRLVPGLGESIPYKLYLGRLGCISSRPLLAPPAHLLSHHPNTFFSFSSLLPREPTAGRGRLLATVGDIRQRRNWRLRPHRYLPDLPDKPCRAGAGGQTGTDEACKADRALNEALSALRLQASRAERNREYSCSLDFIIFLCWAIMMLSTEN